LLNVVHAVLGELSPEHIEGSFPVTVGDWDLHCCDEMKNKNSIIRPSFDATPRSLSVTDLLSSKVEWKPPPSGFRLRSIGCRLERNEAPNTVALRSRQI
jgi:hypothetical protein